MIKTQVEARTQSGAAESQAAELPDLSVLNLCRRSPPTLDLSLFGPRWEAWIRAAAGAAACPVDYVVAPLLASASTLIGNARWAKATPGWIEPPHLWCASVGDSGSGKSPGADIFYRHILPPIEHRMAMDFTDLVEEHRRRKELADVKQAAWRAMARKAETKGLEPPLPPDFKEEPAPVRPRLVMSDVTIEKVADLLARATPKGLLMARDELAGFFLGLDEYNSAGRPFWLEAYGGRPYSVDRVSHPESISVPRLVVGWHGGIQPSRLAEVMRGPDDGLLSRWCWFWPEPTPFRLTTAVPDIRFAVAAFDRLGMLTLRREEGRSPEPIPIPLVPAALSSLESFTQAMHEFQQEAGGLMNSALGKARGLVLRLSLVLEYLRWAAQDGYAEPPQEISAEACAAAIDLATGYLVPMAERVYGDAAAPLKVRNTATLARWIKKTRGAEVHLRHLQRDVRLPGLNQAEAIRDACNGLVEAGWLSVPPESLGPGRPRIVYRVRPELLTALQALNASFGRHTL
jgi:hypothetical protein